MNEYVIYKDEELKITINEDVHNFLIKRHPPSFELSKTEASVLLGIALTELKNKNIDISDKHVQYVPKVPVIDASYIVSYKPPLDVFNLATTYLTLVPTLEDKTIFGEIIETFDVMQYAYEIPHPVHIQIYDKPINNIYGSFTCVNGESILILFWSFKENPEALEGLEGLII